MSQASPACRPALGPTQPLTQLVREALSSVIKRSKLKTDHSASPIAFTTDIAQRDTILICSFDGVITEFDCIWKENRVFASHSKTFFTLAMCETSKGRRYIYKAWTWPKCRWCATVKSHVWTNKLRPMQEKRGFGDRRNTIKSLRKRTPDGDKSHSTGIHWHLVSNTWITLITAAVLCSCVSEHELTNVTGSRISYFSSRT